MPKVTFSNAKGILQEAGSGFQVNDTPILEEIEALADSASFTVTVNTTGDTGSDLDGKYFLIADASGTQFHVWFDIGNTGTADPDPLDGESTSVEVSTVTAGDAGTVVAGFVATAINARAEFTATATDEIVTVSCLELGQVRLDLTNGVSDLVTIGDLEGIGAGEETFAVAMVSNSSSTTSALATFGVTNLAQANDQSVAGTATLAATAAGTKKLIVLPASPGAGSSVVVTYPDTAGVDATATFDTAEQYVYLLSTGDGWTALASDLA
jgi:hypothetical protein